VTDPSASDWQRALEKVRVPRPEAARWSPAMAKEWAPSLFSRGMDDVLDLLPQVLHECANFTMLEERLNYSSAERLMAVWPSRFPTAEKAKPYVGNPQGLAELVYGGRMGNSRPGWGWLFRGQGPIMFTGYDTFRLLEDLSDAPDTFPYQDFTVQPWLVLQPHIGLGATRLWWERRIPDGCLSDQVLIRRRVNGGKVGLDHCVELAQACRRAFA